MCIRLHVLYSYRSSGPVPLSCRIMNFPVLACFWKSLSALVTWAKCLSLFLSSTWRALRLCSARGSASQWCSSCISVVGATDSHPAELQTIPQWWQGHGYQGVQWPQDMGVPFLPVSWFLLASGWLCVNHEGAGVFTGELLPVKLLVSLQWLRWCFSYLLQVIIPACMCTCMYLCVHAYACMYCFFTPYKHICAYHW